LINLTKKSQNDDKQILAQHAQERRTLEKDINQLQKIEKAKTLTEEQKQIFKQQKNQLNSKKEELKKELKKR